MSQELTGIAAIGSGLSVLGESVARIPVGGKIRPGIKVLTPAAAEHPKAKEIYAAGVKAGQSFQQIEQTLREVCKFTKSPMRPKNTPFFVVDRGSFANPAAAQQIMDMFAEDRGDGHKRLYRFPVIFPMDAWQAVMPHALRCYTNNELKFWAQYDDHDNRLCVMRAPVEIDKKSKRAHRHFGGRQIILRPDNNGVCDPDNCPEFQSHQCNLSGAVNFYIPGIAGASVIELPTTSFYGLANVMATLQMVSFLTGGRISGTFENKPIFWISKKLQEVSRIDPDTGKPKKVKQLIIHLDADIDMIRVFNRRSSQPEALALESGAKSVVALGHITSVEDTVDEEPDGGVVADDDAEGAAPAAQVKAEEAAAVEEAPPADKAKDDADKAKADSKSEIKKKREDVFAAIKLTELNTEAFGEYAIGRWGAKWSKTHEGLDAALADLKAGIADLVAYRQKVVAAAPKATGATATVAQATGAPAAPAPATAAPSVGHVGKGEPPF
ncbi:MAG: recombination directionality factor [Sulfobacillus sp.]